MLFSGSIPAIITPFDNNLEIDYDSLEKHINFLIAEGSHGLVSCGTTGESPTLDHEEHKRVTEFIIKKTNKRVPVMAGCGSNSTKESIDFVKHAKSVGASASLVVTPYYNKPSQDGLYLHFKKIADACKDLPVYLYNIPGRSIVKINSDIVKKLSRVQNIVGVKDATADLTTPLEIRNKCGKKFQQLSGEDATFLAFLISGGDGCISVTANVAPKICSQIYEFWKEGRIIDAMNLNYKIFPLNQMLFIESSPCPVKYALSRMNKCKNILRPPLVKIQKSNELIIDKVLKNLGFVK